MPKMWKIKPLKWYKRGGYQSADGNGCRYRIAKNELELWMYGSTADHSLGNGGVDDLKKIAQKHHESSLMKYLESA